MIAAVDWSGIVVDVVVPILGIFLGRWWHKSQVKDRLYPYELDRLLKDLGGVEALKEAYLEGERSLLDGKLKREVTLKALRRITKEALPWVIPDFMLNFLVELIVTKVNTGEVSVK